jgi:hypothetical protein
VSASAAETPHLVEVERLRGLEGGREGRVVELEQAAHQKGRRKLAAQEALAEFYRQRERRRATATDPDVTGDPLPDEGEPTEEDLIAELREADEGLTVRPAVKPFGDGLMDVELDVVDPKAEAMLAEARDLLAEARGELRAYVVAHLHDLAVERAPRAREVADRCETTLRLVNEAMGAYEAERAWWASLLRLTVGEGEVPLVDVPGNPFEGLSPGVKVLPPLPERLIA